MHASSNAAQITGRSAMLILSAALFSLHGVSFAHAATSACTAQQIIANETSCPVGSTAPCRIAKDYVVPSNGCLFDFTGRDVTIAGSSLFNIGSRTALFRAKSIVLETSAEVRGNGDSAGSNGANITFETSETLTLLGTATIDVSSAVAAGEVTIDTGGPVDIQGRIRANGTAASSQGGTIRVEASGSTMSSGTLEANSGSSLFSGGEIIISAGESVSLSGPTSCLGADGGSIYIEAGSDVHVSTELNVDATGTGGGGGAVDIRSEGMTNVLSRIIARGKGGAGQASGDGGGISLSATGGLIISANILADGAGYAGSGGEIAIATLGTLHVGTGVTVSASTPAGEGAGGSVAIEAGPGCVVEGNIRATAGAAGGAVSVRADGNFSLFGSISSAGSGSGSFGGPISLAAGDSAYGALVVSGIVDASGGICGTTGCGLGGEVTASGCDMMLTSATVLTRGASGGDVLLATRDQLLIDSDSRIDASHSIGLTGIDGTILLGHAPLQVPDIDGSAALDPAPVLLPVNVTACAP